MDWANGDSQVVSDTLAFNLPCAENRRSAQAAPGSDERDRFCEVLRDELKPWCERYGSKVGVYPVRVRAAWPWDVIVVRTGRRHATDTVPEEDWTGLLNAADEAAATEILVEDGSDGLLIGRPRAEALLEQDAGAATRPSGSCGRTSGC